ncbi:hypothetical protein INT47_003677 [Mucor saturninus]|uniref:Uncharacterized protein n=1 Tax=Mucor saturninus TaxID=64648 RepID=A0A8H7V4D2_9FUNG|nr:hypothetical protein INT47_003677 [Mucor saturninus]
MGFMKRFFGPHIKEDSPSSTPSHSNVTSPAGSIVDVDMHKTDKYHNDPMRTGKKPDTMGNFLDPMGGHGSYAVSRDVTNTGA